MLTKPWVPWAPVPDLGDMGYKKLLSDIYLGAHPLLNLAYTSVSRYFVKAYLLGFDDYSKSIDRSDWF